MKKFELKQIIKEEIRKILNEDKFPLKVTYKDNKVNFKITMKQRKATTVKTDGNETSKYYTNDGKLKGEFNERTQMATEYFYEYDPIPYGNKYQKIKNYSLKHFGSA